MRLNEFAQKNFMRLENNTAEMQMRESNLPQARVDLRNRILLLVITLVILAAVLVLLWHGISNVTTPTVEEQRADFIAYACDVMEEYKASLLLGERSPEVLRNYKNWQETQLDTDDPTAAAGKLLPGQQLSLWDWETLKVREAERMFDDWYAETADWTGDKYIAHQVSRRIQRKTMPCLHENFWLVENGQGAEYLLIRDSTRWAVKPLDDFR